MLFLSGLLLGLTLAFRVTQGEPFWPPNTFIKRVAVFTIVFASSMPVVYLVDHLDKSLADDAFRTMVGYIRLPLFEFVMGVGIGSLLFYVLSVIGAGAGYAIPMLAALGISALLSILVLTDARYGWFRRMQSLTVAGSGVQFASITAAPSPRQADPLAAITRSAPDAGSNRVAWGLEPFKLLGLMVEYDAQNWATTVGNNSDHRLPALQSELWFARDVIVPMSLILIGTHERRAQVGSPPEGIRFARALSGFAHNRGRLAAARERDIHADQIKISAEYRADWVALRADLESILSQELSVAYEARDRSVDELFSVATDRAQKLSVPQSREECLTRSKEVEVSFERIERFGESHEIFSNRLPYGASVMAWSLALEGELAGALGVLERWLERAEARAESHPQGQFAIWRGTTNLAQLLFRSRLDDADLGYAVEVARRQVAQGQKVLESPGWEDVLSEYEIAKVVARRGSVPACRTLRSSNQLQSFLRTHVEAVNNFVNYSAVLSRKHGHDERLDWHHWAEWVKQLDEAAPECLDRSKDQAKDREEVLLSTAYLAYAALAERSDSQESKIIHLCKAKNVARKRRELLFRLVMNEGNRERPAPRSAMQRMQNRRFDRPKRSGTSTRPLMLSRP
ncbi:hypothetical protein [Enterovirga sp. CN4-39]|uniref:hypothetical protein n=1 Tax=Enterovirga sp. CN4-39 TaxID=3400910 RepID=UPI003BFEAF7A